MNLYQTHQEPVETGVVIGQSFGVDYRQLEHSHARRWQQENRRRHKHREALIAVGEDGSYLSSHNPRWRDSDHAGLCPSFFASEKKSCLDKLWKTLWGWWRL